MAKKTEKENSAIAVGDKIVTKRHGEIVGAVVTAINGEKIEAVQIVGENFTVEGEHIPLA